MIRLKGRYRNQTLEFDQPLELAEGAEVESSSTRPRKPRNKDGWNWHATPGGGMEQSGRRSLRRLDTEGEDKPLKYPATFHHADLMVLNKIDLLPYVPFSMELARENARRVQPEVEILEVSCTSGAGLDQWNALDSTTLMTDYPVINGLIFCGLGIIIFIIAFSLLLKLAPLDLWKQIGEERNVAAAILAGAVVLGICWIIAATMH